MVFHLMSPRHARSPAKHWVQSSSQRNHRKRERHLVPKYTRKQPVNYSCAVMGKRAGSNSFKPVAATAGPCVLVALPVNTHHCSSKRAENPLQTYRRALVVVLTYPVNERFSSSLRGRAHVVAVASPQHPLERHALAGVCGVTIADHDVGDLDP